MEKESSDRNRGFYFDGIVLSGGGIRGIGELGALHYYHESGKLDPQKVKVYACTSIGSVISLLMICGYDPTEIFTKAYTLANIIPMPGLVDIYQGIKNYGIMSIEPLTNIVKDMVLAKLKKIPTLSELYTITGKVLVVSVGNVSKIRGEWFSHINKPNLSVIDVIKMSCNLPVIFKRIRYNGDYYIDGGFTDNFPFDRPELVGGPGHGHPGSHGQNGHGCKNILGIAVLSKSFFGDDESIFSYPYNILLMCVMHSLNSRLKMIAAANDQMDFSNSAGPAKNITLVRLNFGNASILEFGASSDKKMAMFMKGYEEAKVEDTKEYLMIDEWCLEKNTNQHISKDGWDDPF
jgi:hypothetical protein